MNIKEAEEILKLGRVGDAHDGCSDGYLIREAKGFRDGYTACFQKYLPLDDLQREVKRLQKERDYFEKESEFNYARFKKGIPDAYRRAFENMREALIQADMVLNAPVYIGVKHLVEYAIELANKAKGKKRP